MEPLTKYALALGAILPFFGNGLSVLIGTSSEFITFDLLVAYILVYIAIFMAQLWLNGTKPRYINGLKKWCDDDRVAFGRLQGMFGMFGVIVLSVCISVSFTGREWAVYLLIPSIVLILFPLVFVPGKEFKRKVPLANPGVEKSALVMLLAGILVITPFVATDSAPNAIVVEFGEDSVHVKAPMFDYRFEYAEIEELNYDTDFEKGYRINGFGTGTISSGLFKNDEFGRYRLAAYTSVEPCITFTYHGIHYAFNQYTESETFNAYYILVSLQPYRQLT